jgi:hypothetical protein
VTQNLTMNYIFSEINLDSSIIYVIILTNLIFLASKLGVPTLNIIFLQKVIVYFRKVFLLSKFKYFCFVTILDMPLISRSCKNIHDNNNRHTSRIPPVRTRTSLYASYFVPSGVQLWNQQPNSYLS